MHQCRYIPALSFPLTHTLGLSHGHRGLIIYPIDPNGETLVFGNLFCISQHMCGITICLKFKPKHEYHRGKRKEKKNTSTRSFFNHCMLFNGCHIFGKPDPLQIRNHYLYPPQTLFLVGILFLRCPSVRPCVRPLRFASLIS